MSVKDTYKQLRELLSNVVSDLEKSENGNKAASQRVRTGTVRLEKLAKLFRKESIAFEKKNKGQKRPAKASTGAKKIGSAATSSAAGKGGSKTATKAKSSGSSKSKGASVKAKPKSAQARTSVRSRQLSIKRATAKLPTRRMGAY
jgi:cobalamin biosynthesis Mg chelatase CobN